MNPQGFSLLYMRRNRADHRSPIRCEDEMPLNFLISNATYRLVTAAEQWLNWWLARRNRAMGQREYDG